MRKPMLRTKMHVLAQFLYVTSLGHSFQQIVAHFFCFKT